MKAVSASVNYEGYVCAVPEQTHTGEWGTIFYITTVVTQENAFITKCSFAPLDTRPFVHMYYALLRK